jgi:hypothetical protein
MGSTYSAIKDGFNRTDEGPPPSSDWWTPAGVTGLKVVSNELAANDNSICAAVWNADSFNANCEASILIPTLPGTGAGVSVAIRVLDVFAGIKGYTLNLVVNAGNDDFRFRRVDSGVAITLKTVSTLNFSNGYGLLLRMIGDVMYGFYYNGSRWIYVDKYDTAGDGTKYQNGGYAGVLITDTTARCDVFRAGNIGYTPAVRVRMG